MKDLLSCELGTKYEKTFSLYRKKGDEKPLFSTTFSGDYRITLRRLLVAATVAAALALLVPAKAGAGKTPSAK